MFASEVESAEKKTESLSEKKEKRKNLRNT